MTRLTIELVPSTCWWSNVRSHVAASDWERLRRSTAQAAGNRCEVCGGRGRRHPVECHEVWEYDDTRMVQRLVRLIALCPSCHEVKHLGLAGMRGRRGPALAHLGRVNGWSAADTEAYAEAVFEQWATRSRHDWILDCTVLEAQGVRFQPTPPASRR
jgi:hypothetical protein